MGGFFCDCFNVHSPFSRIHDHVAPCGTVQQDRDIKFTGFAFSWVVHIFRNQYLVHGFTRWWCLRSYQLHADDLICNASYLIKVFSQLDASPFSTSTRMDLCFDHVPACSSGFGELFCGFNSFVSSVCH